LAAARVKDESTFSFKDSTMAKLHDDIDIDALVTELKLLKNISSSFAPDTFETARHACTTQKAQRAKLST